MDFDYLITGDTIQTIYAFGDTDPEDEDPFYHGSSNRGTKSIHFLDEPLGDYPDGPGVFHYEILMNEVEVPVEETSYWCAIHQAPQGENRRHVIAVSRNCWISE